MRKLAEARAIAEDLVGILRPFCNRIEIAGSIRREGAWVKDAELVLIPKLSHTQASLFEEPSGPPDRSAVLDQLNLMLDRGEIEKRKDDDGRIRWGFKHQRAVYKGLAIDVFGVVPPATWGVIMAIRTGPADFSKWAVTSENYGGLIPVGMKVSKGQLWKVDQWEALIAPIDTPEEADFFREIGYLAPDPGSRHSPESFNQEGGSGW